MPEGSAMNSELYCEQLGQMYTVLREKYPSVKRNHQDNAKSHTLQKLEEFDGVKLLLHPDYYHIWINFEINK